jgi:conjugal transfer pilus assembly protein TraV
MVKQIKKIEKMKRVKNMNERNKNRMPYALATKITAIVGAVILLSGCAGINSQFDCHKVGGLGAGCVSLDHVNQMANSGDFNHPTSNNARSIQAGLSKGDQYARQHQLKALRKAGMPVRTGESVQRVWVAPFVDTSGNYHTPSTVYTVTRSSRWIGEPVKAIKRSGARLS